ncbi:MAG: YceI family protein [Bacteroidota bacterium]
MKKNSWHVLLTATILFLITATFVNCTSTAENKEPALGIGGSAIPAKDPTLLAIEPVKTVAAKPEGASSESLLSDFNLKTVKAYVEGTSTLHDWKSEITKIECKGTFQSFDKTLEAIKNVEVKIPVSGIISEEGKIMDDKTYEAFKSDKNPFITYAFSSAKVKIAKNRSVNIEASGNLTMAGSTRPVSLTANGKLLANGDLQLNISKKLKMTDFNMKPPTAIFGTIKTGDAITVNFDLVLTKLKTAEKIKSLTLNQ